jgi:hypothetical protein
LDVTPRVSGSTIGTNRGRMDRATTRIVDARAGKYPGRRQRGAGHDSATYMRPRARRPALAQLTQKEGGMDRSGRHGPMASTPPRHVPRDEDGHDPEDQAE